MLFFCFHKNGVKRKVAGEWFELKSRDYEFREMGNLECSHCSMSSNVLYPASLRILTMSTPDATIIGCSSSLISL